MPGTDVVTVATFDLISEAVGRPEDFSSNIVSLLYRDDEGLPARLDFGGHRAADAGDGRSAVAHDPP